MDVGEEADFSHLPSGQLAWRALVEQISKIDATAERHFYEIKSDVDLNRKEGRAKVAKFVLGAANRDPEQAAPRFDGRALMFLGLGHGTTPGIAGFEALELQGYVRKFTGTPGPGWDFERIDVGDDTAVIVLIVGPPDPTHQPWACMSEGPEKLYNGRIYIRGDGNTREANGDEINAMLERRKVAAMPKVELSVEVVGIARRYGFDPAGVERYIEANRQSLLDALPKPKPAQPIKSEIAAATTVDDVLANRARFGNSLSGLAAFSSTTPEKRTQEHYLAEIDAWADEVRTMIPELLDRAAGSVWPGVAFKVTNATDTYLDVPELHIHIDGPVEALRKRDRNDLPKLLSELPDPPRKWGPTVNNHGLLGNLGMNYVSPVLPNVSGIARGPRYGSVKFKNGGSVDLTFSFESLRPRGVRHSDDDDFVLIVRKEGLQQLTGRWMATIKGRDAVYEGELSVTVAQEPGVFTKWVDRQLEVDTSDNV